MSHFLVEKGWVGLLVSMVLGWARAGMGQLCGMINC